MNLTEAQAQLDALDPDTRDCIAQALWMRELRAEDLPADVLERVLSYKNSNHAFGERMAYRLEAMLERPDSFLPSYEKRYSALLQYCESLSVHHAYAMTGLLGLDSSKGFQQIPDTPNFQFPRDNAEQLGTQVGWYFFVGSAKGSNGKEYGIELMFWRAALLPVPVANHFGLSAVENQIVELQFAIAEAGDRHYQARPIVIAGTTGLLDFAPDRLGETMGKNKVTQLTDDSFFPCRIQAWGLNQGGDEPVELSIDLTFMSGKERIFQGANGCQPCCGGVGTLYYSTPHLVMDPSNSTLTLKGEQVQLTEGTFWFDHQWGTGMFPTGGPRNALLRAAGTLGPAGAGGWDWFMAQFEGSHEITYHKLHDRDHEAFYKQTGPTPPGTMTVPVFAKYMDPDKNVRDVNGTMTVPEWIKSEDSPYPAQYQPTDTWYPNKWVFQFGTDVPEEIRSFTMEPIVATGQSGFFAFGAQYSEGAVYLKNPQGREIGRGFAESVLYADPLHSILRLAGLPETDEMVEQMGAPQLPTLRKLATIAYLAWPPNGAKLKQLLKTCTEHGVSSEM